LHIHTRKRKKLLFNFEKIAFLGVKKDEKRGFGPVLGRPFRPVAQNFSQKQESPILLPFMVFNGIFLPKTPPFFEKSGIFLCKLPKKAENPRRESAIGSSANLEEGHGCLSGSNPGNFVQNCQN